MALKVHHLNCGSLCPLGAKWMSHIGGVLDPAPMVCHCLLIETEMGLVLVDTGFGLKDIENPYQRLGRAFTNVLMPRLSPEETAKHQIEKLGFSAKDVKHIILTHLDIDHAGGISDFPHAQVHLYEKEYQAIDAPILRERLRFKPIQWSHHPYWQPHKLSGESWNGFAALRPLHESIPDIMLIPLIGHTRGHSGVAVNSKDSGWLFHCGDAFFHHHQISDDTHQAPPLMMRFQELEAMDETLRVVNVNRLKALNANHPEVSLFCSHDHQEFYCLQQGLPMHV